MALDPVQLATFHAVIEHGSFDAAARALHVTPSAVSQRIKALEQVVGQVLVRRVRPCEPTTAGEALVRLGGQIALLEQEALASARGALTGRTTRVAVVINADSLAYWFLPALAAVPDVIFDLHTDDEGHTAELLRAGTVMAAVTTEHVPVQGCSVRRLGAMRYLAVASPAAYESWFAGRELAEALPEAPMVRFNRKDVLQHRFAREVTGLPEVDPPAHCVPASSAFDVAVRLGLGWGLLPEQVAAADIAAGRLRDLAPGRQVDVPLYWQRWRLESAALTTLTAAVTTAAAAALR